MFRHIFILVVLSSPACQDLSNEISGASATPIAFDGKVTRYVANNDPVSASVAAVVRKNSIVCDGTSPLQGVEGLDGASLCRYRSFELMDDFAKQLIRSAFDDQIREDSVEGGLPQLCKEDSSEIGALVTGETTFPVLGAATLINDESLKHGLVELAKALPIALTQLHTSSPSEKYLALDQILRRRYGHRLEDIPLFPVESLNEILQEQLFRVGAFAGASLMVTAAHILRPPRFVLEMQAEFFGIPIESEPPFCETHSFVFDWFAMDRESSYFRPEQIKFCKRGWITDGEIDLAVIELDEKIHRRGLDISLKDFDSTREVCVYGFPFGLPMTRSIGEVVDTRRAHEIRQSEQNSFWRRPLTVSSQMFAKTSIAGGNSGGPFVDCQTESFMGVASTGGAWLGSVDLYCLQTGHGCRVPGSSLQTQDPAITERFSCSNIQSIEDFCFGDVIDKTGRFMEGCFRRIRVFNEQLIGLGLESLRQIMPSAVGVDSLLWYMAFGRNDLVE